MIRKWALQATDGTIGAETFNSAGEAMRARAPGSSSIPVQVDAPGAFDTLATMTEDSFLKALCTELAKRFP